MTFSFVKWLRTKWNNTQNTWHSTDSPQAIAEWGHLPVEAEAKSPSAALRLDPGGMRPALTTRLGRPGPGGWQKASCVPLRSSAGANTNSEGHKPLATGPSLQRSPRATEQLPEFCQGSHRPSTFSWNSPTPWATLSMRSSQGTKERFLSREKSGN